MAPLAGMSYLGRWSYWAALSMKGVEKLGSLVPVIAGGAQGTVGSAAGPGGTVAGALTGVIEGSILHKIGQSLGDLIDVVFYPMFFTGLALAYFVPSLPFLRFLFGVLGWMLAFVECVFLVPVLLVLTISAEKGPFFTPPAKAALWNIAALIVRPLFTLAGFVVGLMVISETIGILNSVMVTMIRSNSATGFSSIVSVFAFVSYLIIYLGTAYVIVNTATKAAELLPHSVYRWMGANAGGERDDAGGIAATLGAVTGNLRHALSKPKKA
jgi:conjugal transfer/type IV secretion protein DotA/TraY